MEPDFKVPDRPGELDAFADMLSDWLTVDAGKWRKQKRTVNQLYGDLASPEYEGPCGRVAVFVRA